jgi:serine/threonine-protein kinase SRK2
MQEIQNHKWFLHNLPADLVDCDNWSYDFEDPNHPPQTTEELMRIIREARLLGAGMLGHHYFEDPALDADDMDLEGDGDIDADSSGEFVCAI